MSVATLTSATDLDELIIRCLIKGAMIKCLVRNKGLLDCMIVTSGENENHWACLVWSRKGPPNLLWLLFDTLMANLMSWFYKLNVGLNKHFNKALNILLGLSSRINK
jgi:hypothetical protein